MFQAMRSRLKKRSSASAAGPSGTSQRQDWQQIARDPGQVYTAPTGIVAAARFEKSAGTWGQR